jgi:hypothetical protein
VTTVATPRRFDEAVAVVRFNDERNQQRTLNEFAARIIAERRDDEVEVSAVVGDALARFWDAPLRGFRDSADIEAMVPDTLAFYARICGRTFARAHAPAGHAIALTSYLGAKGHFEQSMTDFSKRDADQHDDERCCGAIRIGQLDQLQGC